MPGPSTVLLLGASLAVLIVISAVTFLCANRVHRASAFRSAVGDGDAELGRGRECVAAGIDETVLVAYPTVVYSKAATGAADGTTCAVWENAGRSSWTYEPCLFIPRQRQKLKLAWYIHVC
jgi:hypothetical protein